VSLFFWLGAEAEAYEEPYADETATDVEFVWIEDDGDITLYPEL
jgi:hypothetical protein